MEHCDAAPLPCRTVRTVKRLFIEVVLAITVAGCGTTTAVHTVTVPATRVASGADATPAPHIATGPPARAGTNDCGPVDGKTLYGNASTSCPFARNVYRAAEAFYRRVGADAAHLTAYSPATGKRYRLVCAINSADQVNCWTATGALVSFQAFTSPPPAPARQTAGSTPATQALPDRALCRDLYDQWRAGDAGSQAAIKQYAQIGCDQAPPASTGRNCPANYGPWGYTPNGGIICAPDAGTPADMGNGDHTITVPASP